MLLKRGLLLILLQLPLLTSCTPTKQYVQSNEIRSVNSSEQEVRDYSGVYWVNEGFLYKNNITLKNASEIEKDSVLNKIGDYIYYVSNGRFIEYSIKNEDETELFDIADNGLVFAASIGYFIFDGQRLTDEYGTVIKDDIHKILLKYNYLLLEHSGGLAVISLITGETADFNGWNTNYEVVDGICYVYSGDKLKLTIKP